MKKNKEGFVLAEAIVVAVFVLGMFTYLAMNIFPLITKYDKAINYNDPNETYLVNVLSDELSAATDVIDLKGVYSFSEESDGTITCDYNGSTCANVFAEDYYKTLSYKHLKAKKMIIYAGVSDVTDDWKNNYMTRGMREYFNYSKSKFISDSTMKILIEFQNGKYASIEVQ